MNKCCSVPLMFYLSEIVHFRGYAEHKSPRSKGLFWMCVREILGLWNDLCLSACLVKLLLFGVCFFSSFLGSWFQQVTSLSFPALIFNYNFHWTIVVGVQRTFFGDGEGKFRIHSYFQTVIYDVLTIKVFQPVKCFDC